MTVHRTTEAMQSFVGHPMTLIACNRELTCGGTFPNRVLEETDDGTLRIYTFKDDGLYHDLVEGRFAYSEEHNTVSVYFDMPDKESST